MASDNTISSKLLVLLLLGCLIGFPLFLLEPGELVGAAGGKKVKKKATKEKVICLDQETGRFAAANKCKKDHVHIKDPHTLAALVGGYLGLNPIEGSDSLPGDGSSSGLQGPKGDPGPKGPTGPQGEQGDPGESGAEGAKGPLGKKGAVGAMGPRGDTGPTGDKGPGGDRGEQGLTGSPGPVGDKGPGGDKGAKGPVGDKGLKINGPKGDRGDPHPTHYERYYNYWTKHTLEPYKDQTVKAACPSPLIAYGAGCRAYLHENCTNHGCDHSSLNIRNVVLSKIEIPSLSERSCTWTNQGSEARSVRLEMIVFCGNQIWW